MYMREEVDRIKKDVQEEAIAFKENKQLKQKNNEQHTAIVTLITILIILLILILTCFFAYKNQFKIVKKEIIRNKATGEIVEEVYIMQEKPK